LQLIGHNNHLAVEVWMLAESDLNNQFEWQTTMDVRFGL
jgi:hypothetical protein